VRVEAVSACRAGVQAVLTWRTAVRTWQANKILYALKDMQKKDAMQGNVNHWAQFAM
jgi:hypothetical protein